MSPLVRSCSFLAAFGAALPCSPGQPDDPAVSELPIDEAAEQRLLERGGSGTRIRRTAHFVIAYNTTDDALLGLTSRLEATHRAVSSFCRINEITVTEPVRRLEVLFFDTYDQYGSYATKDGFTYQGSSGFYSQRTNVAAFYNILNAPELAQINSQIEQLDRRIEKLRTTRPIDRAALKARSGERARLAATRDRTVERINRTSVQHETAHQLFFNLGVHVLGARNPGWVVEGLACLFETPPSSSGAGLGATNQMRLADFRACVGGGNPRGRLKPEDLQTALDAKQFLPLGQLVSDPEVFSRRSDRNLVHYYSQAWALVCYLQRAKPEEFAEYLRVLGRRQPGQDTTSEQELADFESVFGPLDEAFQQRWATYILTRLRFKPSQVY